ncbi:MAG: MscL family protein [Candidatus Bathyarchaeota archaeon]|nr:MscL family protein [Candidatus Bathyarchaeota archaeon]
MSSKMRDAMLEEWREIRAVLDAELAPAPPPPHKGLLAEFKDFLSEYKVMGLAVAFILGVYLGQLVQALVNDLVMPIINLALPGVPWEQIMAGPFRVGHFLGQLITFVIVALVIFALVKVTARLGIK